MKGRKFISVTGVLLTVGVLCALFCTSVTAAVNTTQEAAGKADTVYVAGNPNWYPVEYYDPDIEAYAGILPEILERISEKTGLDFTYIQAGNKDQRERLAKNGQVELVSGCAADEAWILKNHMSVSDTILVLPSDDGNIPVCLAFSRIADDALIRRVEEGIAQMTPQEISGISVEVAAKHPYKNHSYVLKIFTGILVVVMIFGIVQTVLLRRYKKAVRQDTHVDLLTGIGTKVCFEEFFNTYISDQYRNLYSVIYIGFDIARVNQYYGEEAAKDQLCFAANELKLCVRDNEIAARVSGSGFVVVRPGSGEKEIELWTKQLLERLNEYTKRYGKDYRPDFQAGIYMLHITDRNSDLALFNARHGYNQAVSTDMPYVFARTEYLEMEKEQLQLKKQILEALQNREFQVFLQFIVRGKDGQICGAEAISRWDHPQKGLLYPGSYINLMESEGTVAELDFYVFEEVCRWLEQWQFKRPDLRISCNFARITIGRNDFVERIQEIAKRYIFNRERLVMEITEDAMEMNKDCAFSNISQCKDMGFLIALDDVGSGYSSFADLRDYPINVVKIDRSVLNAAVTERGAALLKGITALAHNLNMEVLCEGAETQVQTDLIRRCGCDFIQGYYFYRPLPMKEAERVLKEQSVGTGI